MRSETILVAIMQVRGILFDSRATFQECGYLQQLLLLKRNLPSLHVLSALLEQ